MNRAETEDGSYASARNRKLLAGLGLKPGENEYAEPALNPCQTTAYAFFAGDQMCSRNAWLLKPRAATTHCGTPGRRSRSGTAWGSSWAWPGARMKATARPSPSAITQALVP